MKAVILAGGFGTRLAEETDTRPKPMVEIGGKPILWHIMKIYSAHGVQDFIICCGYKGYVIKEYFANYMLHASDVTFDLRRNEMEVRQNSTEPWRVTLIDTGMKAGTGGRLLGIRDYIGDEDFCFTYGDGVCNIDLDKLVDFHRSQKTLATLTMVQPPHRFGALRVDDNNKIEEFEEKPREGGWINGGFFIMSPRVLDYIDDETVMLESTPMQRLVQEKNISAYRHSGFWYSMDSLRDKRHLEALWESGSPPWKIW